MPTITADTYYAIDLLSTNKFETMSLTHAVLEAATPQVRDVLLRHINDHVRMHGRIFNYMHSHGMYEAYHIDAQVPNSIRLAETALRIR